MTVSYSGLNGWCVDTLTQVKTWYSYTLPLFQLQYDCGCRFSETLNLANWTELVGEWELVTEKTGAVRVIPDSDLSARSIDYLRGDQRNYPRKFYNRAHYQLVQSRPFVLEYRNGSDCLSHAFRHRRARAIVESGGTVADVQAYLKVTSSVASRYVNEPLFHR